MWRDLHSVGSAHSTVFFCMHADCSWTLGELGGGVSSQPLTPSPLPPHLRSMLDQPHQRGRARAANPLLLYRSQSARPRAKWHSGSSDEDSSPAPGLTHSESMCSALPLCSESRPRSGLVTSANSNQCSTLGGQTRLVSSSRGSTPGGHTRPTSSSRSSIYGGQMRPMGSSRGSTPSGQMRPTSSSRGSIYGGQMRPMGSSRGSTPGVHTRPARETDSQSNVSTASSGIFTDYLSPKSSLPRSRHASTSPSPLALKSHTTSSTDSSCRPKSSVWSELNGAGPLPPSQVRARLDAAALSVSWEPVR